MLKPKIHLCLVYNTATANVTPALDPAFQPEEVILLHSPDKGYRATSLENVLKPTGIKVSRWSINDNRDVEHIRERVLELLVEREQDDIALNASGGTRPMSMAAYEIFREFNKPIFYVHPETDYVTWIHQRNLPSFNVADHIKLRAFLQAHGAGVGSMGDRSGVSQNLRELAQDVIKHIKNLATPLAALNWLAQQAQQGLSVSLKAEQRQWQALEQLIERFAAENLLKYQRGRIEFASEAARFFVNGGWLEQHTYGVLFGLRKEIPKIQDVGYSVEISRDSTGKAVKNELDVAFLHNNHLHIIECKTRRFNEMPRENQSINSHAADVLYKLDTLKSILGDVHTKVMLVSYHSLSDWDKQRAHDLGISICAGQQLGRLEEILKIWVEN